MELWEVNPMLILLYYNLKNGFYLILQLVDNDLMIGKPKYFEDAALSKGATYFEYENYEIETNDEQMQNYEVMEKIGRGKYSDVYKCINSTTDQLSVLKILKPVRFEKIKRQIKILRTLRGKPHIIDLQNVMYDTCSKCYSLACPFVDHIDVRDIPDKDFKLPQIKKFIFAILKALEASHSCGIMHRDIKPQNVLYDKNNGNVLVADWGLADYYLPGKEYNVRVASRYYKGPELLLNYKYYGYSLDIWSLGCVFAGLIFRKPVIFRGDSNTDQMRLIADQTGSEEVAKYISKYKIKPERDVVEMLNQKARSRRAWKKFINKQNEDLASEEALDLLEKMLVIDHEERITTSEAMKHPFFH